MTKNTISLFIIIIFCTIIYRYLNLKEHFEENNTNKTIDNTTMENPESYYKMKDFYLERPPISSTIVKKEIKHEMPTGLIENDINISNNKKLIFGTKDNNEIKQHYSINSNNGNFRINMKDDKDKTNSFQVWGGSCIAQGDCSKEGANLHDFSDKPEYNIRTPTGKVIHNLNQAGDAKHTGSVSVGNLTNPKHHIDGTTGNQYSTGVVNAKDVNVRGRIYFSQVKHNQDIKPGSSNWSEHHTDPFYIEKLKDGVNSELRITINDDAADKLTVYGNSCGTGNCYGPGKKLFELDGNGNLFLAGKLTVQDGVYSGKNTFRIEPAGNFLLAGGVYPKNVIPRGDAHSALRHRKMI